MIVAGIECVATGKISRTSQIVINEHQLPLKKAMSLDDFIWVQQQLCFYQKQRAVGG